ncbi:predicted protein [Nematostella vectensis]|uniref:Elongation factor 1 beta central acidic region eukaryote domain-containing protein n=1 Tax=Nematostella vectensis TaxID=45351 RepID=A7SQR0_NEMVE|nr:predicted protein [Nematostella vectensis]|eukprot:XP_001626054.1 predicted protein [Nematostella vectensis]
MGFGDLKSQAGLSALNTFLTERSYIEGYVPSQADAVVFEALKSAPPASLPHALRWYNHIVSYGEGKQNFPGEKKSVESFGPAGAASEQKPAPADDNDDDEIDLFGSDDEEEEKEAARIRQERLKAYEEKKAKKKPVIAKSNIMLDVKPWDDETGEFDETAICLII